MKGKKVIENVGGSFLMVSEEQLKKMVTSAIVEAKEQAEEERKQASEVAAISRKV